MKLKHADFAPPRIAPDCGAPGCRQKAIAYVRAGGNAWIHLCAWHYERQHQAQAKAYCERHELVSARDHSRHCASFMRRVADRAPGEDDAG